MQLFIQEKLKVSGNSILVEDLELLQQLRKVLRAKIGYVFFLQEWFSRYKVELIDRDDKKIVCKILDKEEKDNIETKKTSMLISMPNKRDKLELIVQKLSEIWVDEILIWASERSVIKQENSNKMKRVFKISQEAIEQSWWWKLPKIKFVDQLKELDKNYFCMVFDLPQWVWKVEDSSNNIFWNNLLWIVWPEWWLTQKDYKEIKDFVWIDKIWNLWDSVLRTETACIIWAWFLKNNI